MWPLSDYVAVNPYAGFAPQEFLRARGTLRKLSDVETLMPIDYYRGQFAEGMFSKADINSAVDEMVADGVDGAERIDVNQILSLLVEPSTDSSRAPFEQVTDPDERSLWTVSERETLRCA